MEVLKLLLMNLSDILFVDFKNLFYKIVVSCITKCVAETSIKIMMTRGLEIVDQIYSST